MVRILTALVAFALTGCKLSPEQEAMLISERAISLCWEEQSKKSLDPATARFVALVCEKKESDYRSKYNRNP